MEAATERPSIIATKSEGLPLCGRYIITHGGPSPFSAYTKPRLKFEGAGIDGTGPNYDF